MRGFYSEMPFGPFYNDLRCKERAPPMILKGKIVNAKTCFFPMQGGIVELPALALAIKARNSSQTH